MKFLGARYLLRFDDLCPTMDWPAWNAIEAMLIEHQVKPLLAVVPDNRDPYLEVAPEAADFWERVRGWQARGWAIGLHGYQHTYVNREAGILGLNPFSEFAGRPFQQQHEMLSKGLELFAREKVRAEAWIAPAHSFDGLTILALKDLGLPVISDGLAFSPFQDANGVTWVPQQFAKMRALPWGVWTFCYHINGITPEGLSTFRRSLQQLGPRMISLQEAVAMSHRRVSSMDRLVGLLRRLISLAQKVKRH
jgi:predicted deacetylase